MRVGLIGAGRIASIHAETVARHPDVESLTIFDPIREAAEGLAQQHGATAVDSEDRLLGGVDAVVIASPTDTHVEYLIMAAERGLPAFCEKPIALSVEETDRAIAAIEKAEISVQIGFQRRFDPGYGTAHDLVASGRLGELLLMTAHTHDPAPPPEDYVARSGGVFKDMLIHDIDAIRFVSGREVVAVYATGSNLTMPVFEAHGDLASVVVAAHLEGGALAILSGSRRDPLGYDVRMEVFGTEDSVAVGLDPHAPIRSLEKGVPPPVEPVTRGWLDRFREAYVGEMRAFIDVAAGARKSPCTPRDGRAAIVVAEACGRSAQTGTPVPVQDAEPG
ncbi:MAG TPA: Gfo/Idh/MocA family oxidoreductase [Actinomycetota bacterium]|nr:Gfo/Idh/MocA family oxidoreductase [Actinomycetota bacterium]